ncbi:MAG: disulfide oxidoreductase [Rhodobacteraceae bacterium]|jgi:ATP-dependent RNA helicase SUPV3L1/SUV3|nr:disulfide oxidoreductase [Paracoccaceae bacterium]
MCEQRITAVLGPTNTGKTHLAVERMLGHRTGIIGLPLRLLAREVYDRIVGLRGPSTVALVTGEERIVPERARWWVCTVEAMPQDLACEFLAIDEIQLCADPERGHVFTDRLLHARGARETMFLGAATMRGAIAALVPAARFEGRSRFSDLTYTGPTKLSRMKPRAAIVGFSADNVYAIAELLRRQKGGAAVVMGALSPRTRNAQVAMYQNGDVDHLVATDAIGMGLNLDIDHVAFAGLSKFDGRRMRPLAPNELAQIAGRAGRYLQPGTFGVTGEARNLPEEVTRAIEDSRFAPVRRLQWRNRRLDFASAGALIAALEARPDDDWLVRGREADDLAALKALADDPEIAPVLRDGRDVRLLWEVCQIPDFRDITPAEHVAMLRRIFGFLHKAGEIPEDWFAARVRAVDRPQGDIDALAKRLAFIRTWTFVAQRRGWVRDETHWRGETRAVEDRLSDALHGALTQRFVDRRTSVLLRRLKQREALVAEVSESGEVTIEGQFAGRLDGFRFRQDASATPDAARTLRSAAIAALAPQYRLRADRLYNAPDTELDFTEQGGLMWGSDAVGRLVAGADALHPQVSVFVDDEAGPEVSERVQRRLQHFIDRRIAALMEPLIALQKDDALPPPARGFGFGLVEALGLLPREPVAAEVKALDQAARGALRKHGVRFGQYMIFVPALLKPAPTRLRLVLWALARGEAEFPQAPPPGLVTIPLAGGVPATVYHLSGYRPAGARAIRIDMLERLADMLRACDSRAGFEASAEMLSITGLTLEQFADLMGGLGYAAERGERTKLRPPRADADASSALAGDVGDTDAEGAEAAAPGPAGSDGAAPADAAPAPEQTAAAAEASHAEPAAPESEVYFTFTWAPKPRHPRREKPKDTPRRKSKGRKPPAKERTAEAPAARARPPRKEKPIDPDNPFAAALMGLRDRS